MKVIAEIELGQLEDYNEEDIKEDKYLLIHSNTEGCNVGKINIISTEDDFKNVADAMRGALGDNPCLLADKGDGTYHFSDKDLIRAFMAAKYVGNKE